MKQFSFIIYAKGSRGITVVSSLIKNLVPEHIVIEKKDINLIDLIQQAKISFSLCAKPKSSEHVNWLLTQKPNLILTAGYSKILPKNLLNIPNYGIINCHGGRLPDYRGASPIPWQIINGETESEAYILKMTEGIDDGPILASKKYTIEKHETSKDIIEKVNLIFEKIVPEIIKKYSNKEEIKIRKQCKENVCYRTRRYPKDSQILWDKMTAVQVVNFVRALSKPYPTAFTFFNKKKIYITKCKVHALNIKGIPGRYVGKKNGNHTIIAKDRAIAIKKFKLQNEDMNNFPAKYGDDFEYHN